MYERQELYSSEYDICPKCKKIKRICSKLCINCQQNLWTSEEDEMGITLLLQYQDYEIISQILNRSYIALRTRNSSKWKVDLIKIKKKTAKQIKESRHQYYLKNIAHIKNRSKMWAKKNPEKINKSKYKWIINNPEKYKAIQKRYREKNPINIWAIGCVQTHKKKGFIVTFKSKDLIEYVKNKNGNLKCPYCDVYLIFNQKKQGPNKNSASLDRINNDHILNLNNIEIICHSCNRRKSQFTKEEFIKYCKNISNKFSINGGHYAN